MLDLSKIITPLITPLIIFIIVFTLIIYSYRSGYVNGVDAQKKKQTAELIKAQDEYMRRYIQLENSQNLELKIYQDKIKTLEAQHEKNIRELTEESIKIKDAISITELQLDKCMHSSKPAAAKVPTAKNTGDFECIRADKLRNRVKRTLDIGHRCDKLAEKYNTLLKICSEH